jgi:hypothetical protein
VSCKVLANPNPFTTDRIEREVEPKPIDAIIEEVLPGVSPEYVRVLIDDEPIPRERFHVIPPDGEMVLLRVVPSGDSGEQTGGKVAGWSFLAFAAGVVLGATPLGWGLMAVGAAGMVGGMAVAGYSYLAGLLDTSAADFEQDEPAPQIRGSRNRAAPWRSIPLVLGKHLVTPYFAAPPYVTIDGSDQYLHQAFVLGFAPMTITDVKIGDTPIGSFSDVDYEIPSGSTPLSLYTNNVDHQSVSIGLEQGTAVERTTRSGTERIVVMLTAPRGLVQFSDDGSKSSVSVNVEIYIRPSGGTYALEQTVTLTGKSSETIRRAVTCDKAAGTYDVKVVRTTANNSSTQVVDTVYYDAYQSIIFEDPIDSSVRDKLVRVGLRIRATDQINGIVDQFNVVAESHAPVWDGTNSGASAWSYGPTSNPASLMLLVLQGGANNRPVADANIDWPSFEEFHGWCDSQGYTYNGVIDGGRPLRDILKQIAAAGHGYFGLRDGKYTVIYDHPQSTPVQHFSPRNSWDFSASKEFPDRPHALRVQFIDATLGWQESERFVYDDGYDETTATKFEETKFPGITDPDLAWKHGRYALATGRLRPEKYTLKADIEHIICTAGDLVRVTHDVPLWGLAVGRITSLTTDGSGNVTDITIDETVTMETGKSYGIRIRKSDGTSITADVSTVVGDTNTLSIETWTSGNSPEVEDLLMFGERDAESVELRLIGIEPHEDLTATLILQDAAPDIYQAESGTIPAYDPQITDPTTEATAPLAPTIENVRSDGTVLVRQSDGSWQNRILITLSWGFGEKPAVQFECRYRLSSTDEPWKYILEDVDLGYISITPAEAGNSYDINVRGVADDGSTSSWVATTHTVVGKEAPPSQVPSVTATVRTGGIEITWQAIPDLDLARYEVRVGSDWASGSVLFSGNALNFLWDMQATGTYQIRVKAVDTSGNYSTTEALFTLDILEPGKVQNLGGQLIDNNLRIYWEEPATGSLPIVEYKVYKGDTFSSSTLIGRLSATWYTISEDTYKNITYYVVAVDAAGNEGPEEYITIDQAKALVVSDSAGTPVVGSRRASYKAGGILLEEWNGAQWIERLNIDISSGIKTHTLRGNNQLLLYSGAYKDVLSAGYATGRAVPFGGEAFAFEESTDNLQGVDSWDTKTGLDYTTICRYGEHAITGDGSAGAQLARSGWLTLGDAWTVEWWLRMASESITEWEQIAEIMAGDTGVRLGVLRLERIYAEDTYCDDYYERTITNYTGTMQLSMYSTGKWQHEELPINTLAWSFLGLSFDGASLYIVYDDQVYNLGNGLPNISAPVQFDFSSALGTIIDMLMVLPGTALSTSTLQDHAVDETGYGAVSTANKMVIFPKSGLLVGGDVEIDNSLDVQGKTTLRSGLHVTHQLHGTYDDHDIYNALSPHLPNVGDKMMVWGSVAKEPSSLWSSLRVISLAERASSDIITLYYAELRAYSPGETSYDNQGYATTWSIDNYTSPNTWEVSLSW